MRVGSYNPLNITLIIVVNALPPFVTRCLTRMLAYQRRNAHAQYRRPYVKPTPTPFTTPLFFPNFSAFVSDFENASTALSSPANE